MLLYEKVFYAVLFFLIGVVFASVGFVGWWVVVAIGISCLSLFLLKEPRIFLWALLICASFAGFAYYHFYQVLNKDILPEGKDFIGLVVANPAERLKAQILLIALRKPYRGKVKVYTDSYPTFVYGDVLNIEGEITKSAYGENQVSFPKIKILKREEGSSVKVFLFKIRNKLIVNLKRVLPLEQAGFAAGIILGDKGGLSVTFTEALKKTSTTHLIAMSGYNISIIAMSLQYIFARTIGKRKSFGASIICIMAFIIMAGAESSVVRAGIMGGLLLVARQISRVYDVKNAVILTAFSMVLLNPKVLVFDLGFQLSFLALLGIIYLEPFITKIINPQNETNLLDWKKNLATTASAQLMVAPVLLYNFGQFNLLAVIPNLLVLQAMPIIMFFGFLTAGLGIVSYELPLVSGWILSILLAYAEGVINICARIF